ncbi:MAG: aminotransferase class III-fold pyridoxal phosphate-dependent enzyme, partial [Clostridia bacterium]|nr:aminotransferase class III-fold pyridoxal phosphate-dependent enzyme [Clostridia bacterium]
GSTFGGNPVSCAGALNILNRLDDKLLKEVNSKSEYIFNRLKNAKGVVSVSGKGLMIGVKTEKDAKAVVNACMERGVLFLTAKDKVRLLPALNIPFSALKAAIDVLCAVCAE